MKRLSFIIALAATLVLSIPLASVLGDDNQEPKKKANAPIPDTPPKKVKKLAVENIVARAYKLARLCEDKVVAITAIKGYDLDGGESIMCMAEFENGSTFFFVGDPDGNDKTVVIEKNSLKLIFDALKRAESRYK